MTTNLLRVIFIDDEQDFLNVAVPDLVDSLSENGIEAQVTAVTDLNEGIGKLGSEDFHLAIVDLKFGTVSGAGNQAILRILATKILPIIVLTAHPASLDAQYQEHGLIYSPKHKQIPEVVTRILEWNEKSVFTFFSEAGFLQSTLRTTLQKTMWDHVSRYWNYIDTQDTATRERIAGRIASNLLHDLLISDPEYTGSGGEVSLHHGEIYIFGTPRKDYLAVGDLLEIAGQLFSVLTPNCDLVVRHNGSAKADEVLLVRCQHLKEYIAENNDILSQVDILNDPEKTKSKKEKAAERLVQMMHQDWRNPSGRYFFLPPFAHFGGGVIDFLHLAINPYSPAEAKALVEKRILSLDREMSAELW